MLPIDDEAAKEILLKEYILPGPMGYDINWYRMLMDQNSMRNGMSAGSNDEWVPPKNLVFLIMFAEPKEGYVDSRILGETNLCYGLVLEDKGDGTYERVANFAKLAMRITNWEDTKSELTKVVKIV